MQKFYIISACFFLLSINLAAQNFTASVNRNPVGENERFQLSFTFSGEDINSLANFIPPAFNDFHVLSGPNQSTSMQIINGAVSASKTLSYYLQPSKTGTFTIGSASIEYKGTKYKSEPIKIEVVKGNSTAKSNIDDNSVSDKDIAENLFIKATVDKRKVYQGEQVTVTYKLYTRLNIAAQMSVSKLPSYQGFWAEELETSNTIMFSTENINGKRFRVGILKKVALFPSQSGELSITPLELKVPVQIEKRRTGNIFDDFFNDPFFDRGQMVEHSTKSNTVKVMVLPLPREDKPESFTGAVGDYSINSSIDKTSLKANESLTLKLVISGTGNIQLVNVPEIELPSGIEKYEPKSSEEINRNNRVSGKKTVEYLLVPRTAGEKVIPSVKFSYFDPIKKSYVNLETKPYTINVEEGETLPGLASSQDGIKILSDDIRFIKTSVDDVEKNNGLIIYSFGFWTATALPLLLISGLIFWKKRDEKLSANLQLLRYQRAQKVAKNRLKTARKLMAQNKNARFYSEISQALYGYLEDKFQIPKSEFTLDRAVDELHKKGIEEDLVNNLKSCTERCEYIRFAPQADGDAAMNEMYKESANIIIEIEKSLQPKTEKA